MRNPLDDEIRALERKTSQDPSDRAARWQLQRLLRRAGRATGRWGGALRLGRRGRAAGRIEKAPLGRLVSASTSPMMIAPSGVRLAGFMTKGQPPASAGAILCAAT